MTQDTDTRRGADAPGLDPALLEVLVCPVTHGPLEYDRARNELVSRQLGRAFPVRAGVPVMLLDEARELSEAEIGALRK
ncbi:MAG: Trm112 family protein [Pseudomonadota bacterium]|nr:hypothetical protein [SAR116 cluster bacterium]MEC7172489.1 Trm112 family protein [Pseudomonadota bacterium]